MKPLDDVFTTRLEIEEVAWADGDLRDAVRAAWGTGDAVLLGHAWDGVLWGRLRSERLELACDYEKDAGARLRPETLADLRVFNEECELRVWRSQGGSILARLVREGPGTDYARLDRSYELLRSPRAGPPEDGPFVRLEGLAGQLHFPPGERAPEAIEVRHYFERDGESGLLRMAEHRVRRLLPLEDAVP